MNQGTYLTEFAEVLLFCIGGTLFVLGALFVSWLTRPHRPNEEKLSTYESGEEAIGSAYPQFNSRFYVIAIIFLLFEIELAFLFCWSTVYADPTLQESTSGVWGIFALLEMLLFVLILGLGLAYAWVKGHLDWIKSDPNPTRYTSGVPKVLYEEFNEKYK